MLRAYSSLEREPRRSMDERPPARKIPCAGFWGPQSRRFGGHTQNEVGTSHLCNVWVMFAIRLCTGLASLGVVLTFGTFSVLGGNDTPGFSPHSLLLLGLWNWFLLAISFFLLASCSLQAGRRKHELVYIPNIAVPLYQTAATGILFGLLIDVTPAWQVLTLGGFSHIALSASRSCQLLSTC